MFKHFFYRFDSLTDFRMAAASGNLERVKKYLERHSDDKEKICNEPDATGKTVLHHAVEGNQFDVTELLIKSGADINARSKRDNTPLHLAVASYQVALTGLLLNNDANYRILNQSGESPYSIAVSSGNNDIIQLFDLKRMAEDDLTETSEVGIGIDYSEDSSTEFSEVSSEESSSSAVLSEQVKSHLKCYIEGEIILLQEDDVATKTIIEALNLLIDHPHDTTTEQGRTNDKKIKAVFAPCGSDLPYYAANPRSFMESEISGELIEQAKAFINEELANHVNILKKNISHPSRTSSSSKTKKTKVQSTQDPKQLIAKEIRALEKKGLSHEDIIEALSLLTNHPQDTTTQPGREKDKRLNAILAPYRSDLPYFVADPRSFIADENNATSKAIIQDQLNRQIDILRKKSATLLSASSSSNNGLFVEGRKENSHSDNEDVEHRTKRTEHRV